MADLAGLMAPRASGQNLTQAWVQRYSGPGQNGDQGKAVAVDSAGNVFVTGSSYDPHFGGIVTIKYSNTGTPLWTNRFDTASGCNPAAMDIDPGGNVIVTGTPVTGGMVTLKYSNLGTPLWTNFYFVSSGQSDQATALAVDASSNVFVAGFSVNPSFNDDYLVIKYSGAGTPLWTNRYNGPGNGTDHPSAIAVDGLGDVFVTGNSSDAIFTSSYATLAYSSAGTPLWTNRYSGTGSGNSGANAIVSDSSGNVVVTGHSPGGDSSDDYATVAYSWAGVPLWTNRYLGNSSTVDVATAVALGTGGNVLVTGYSQTNSAAHNDFLTIAYSQGGTPLWTNRYNGPADSTDQAVTVHTDPSGNVIVTGSSFGTNSDKDYATVAYTSAGVPLWTNRFNGPDSFTDQPYGMAVDTTGNVFVTGSTLGTNFVTKYATVAWSSNGTPLWTNFFAGTGSHVDVPTALAVDAAGNALVTGYSFGTGHYDFATVKYSGSGTPLWTNRFVGNDLMDSPTAIAVDSGGNVAVTGSPVNTTGRFITIRYSSAGTPLWTNIYKDGSLNLDNATAVTIDSASNVIVTGRSYGFAQQYATIKYTNSGAPLWTNFYTGPATQTVPVAIVSDPSNNIIVTGYSQNASFVDDYLTVRYSSTGVPLWTNRFNGPFSINAFATGVAVDTNGNAFVTGYSTGSGTGVDYSTIKYLTNGVAAWTNRYNGPGNGFDAATAITVDSTGNVIVTGYSRSASSDYDYATIKYSNAGVPQWTNFFNGPANTNDQPVAVGTDAAGNVFVTGLSSDLNGVTNFATIAYSAAGTPFSTNYYAGFSSGTNLPVALAVDASGSVFVAGMSTGLDGQGDFATVKYVALPPPTPLNITPAPSGAVLVWTNSAFRLQSAGTVNGTFSDVPGASSPYTNTGAGQSYFRLIAP